VGAGASGGSAGVAGASRSGVGTAGVVGSSGTTGSSGVVGVDGISMPCGYPSARSGIPGRAMAPLTDGFAELTLQARDPERLERFYVDGVGLEVLARETDRVWLAAGTQARLGLWTPGEKEFGDEGGAHVHYAFSAAPGRLDAIAERLRAHGAAVRGPEEHAGGDRSIYVQDPEGNLVEVWDYFGRGGEVEGLRASRP
jgi:catechol 2,3-dioxygenase-like lactoylglutathione lyase family enzyme